MATRKWFSLRRGRRPRAAALAPLGQFTFCPHRPSLCQAGAPSMGTLFVSVVLSCLRRAPFCADRKGRKSRLRRGIPISPALTIHPLKRPRRGNRDSPFLELPPGCSAGGFPAAGAYAVPPPPHRPVCEKTGERRWNVGAGLVPARRGFPQRRGIEATTRAAPTVAQNRERICRYPVRSSGRRVVISLPPVYTTVSERFFLTFHPVEGVW